ncbi:MAG: YggS family pyridoxal phosphate-dependent enzyme [Gammaproteobacteria bacterium]|nr:YggS family pyridoxal phosphate-dependent enzyme [Gammaproteobacteria bacterium]
MTDLAKRLQAVHEQIVAAARAADRDKDEIRLVAVSKTKPYSAIEEACALGQRDFGENYLQEAIDKIRQAREAGLDVRWHFIGAIQSNKTREIAEHFDWVQTIDRIKIARRLDEQRPAALAPLNVLIQVNVDAEPQKAGVMMDEITPLADFISGCRNLRLRGLMAIPAASEDKGRQRGSAEELDACMRQLNTDGYSMDTLSIGMTNDLDSAIAGGSTMLRIGTAIFGPRV